LCIWPEPPTFAQLGELASNALGVPRWPLVDLVRASFEEPDQLASLAETIGRTPHSALAALVLAARVRQECGQRSELAEAIGAALLVLVRDEPLPGLRDPEDDAGQRQRTESLTPRETQVALLAATLPNTAVASMLGIGVRTIENHIHSALKKTGARNRQELFARLRGTS
jgi:DNA-binding NarL/FixJ family response regulator